MSTAVWGTNVLFIYYSTLATKQRSVHSEFIVCSRRRICIFSRQWCWCCIEQGISVVCNFLSWHVLIERCFYSFNATIIIRFVDVVFTRSQIAIKSDRLKDCSVVLTSALKRRHSSTINSKRIRSLRLSTCVYVDCGCNAPLRQSLSIFIPSNLWCSSLWLNAQVSLYVCMRLICHHQHMVGFNALL